MPFGKQIASLSLPPHLTSVSKRVKILLLAPSSSGPGRLVLIQKIAGSTPAGVTKN